MPDLADSGGLVLDTSVWLNLLATDAMEAILSGLAVPCYAPEQVVMEVRRHPASGVKYQTDDHPLRRASSKVSLLSLEGKELDLFLEIVGAPTGDALGDGEAAVIAAAMSRGLDVVIDDKKARRILRERFSKLRIYWTVDLLQARSVIATLGRTLADECFEKACRLGRMHVPRL